MSSSSGWLGLDVGSISVNVVVVNEAGEVLFQSYDRGGGSPVAAVQRALAHTGKSLPQGLEIRGVCTTGSGRNLIGAVVGADVVKNEITAHARAAIHVCPEVQTIFEIGGQDSKATVVRDRAVVDFAMNLVCAAGTGSFLDSQAKRLGISIEELSAAAVTSTNPTDIAGRCTVFAESDMIHKQQVGHAQPDIVMGLCHAMVRNYLSNVCRGKEVRPPILFQGGVSANQGIVRAFREALGFDVIIPQHAMVMGAYGAALIALRSRIEKTRFRGFEVSAHEVATSAFRCTHCENLCDIVELKEEGKVFARSGGRCARWEGRADAGAEPVPATGPVGQVRPAFYSPLAEPELCGSPQSRDDARDAPCGRPG
jgi:predicted CoA-substrate-specific enzyme activase